MISSVTQGITTALLGEGATPAPSNDKTIAASGPIDSLTRAAMNQFRGPRGFNLWLEAMEKAIGDGTLTAPPAIEAATTRRDVIGELGQIGREIPND